MGDPIRVQLKPRSFVTFSVAGHAIELFVDELSAGGVMVSIKSAKKLSALRVFQELPGLEPGSKTSAATSTSAGSSDAGPGAAPGDRKR